MIDSPKKRFLASPAAQAHDSLVNSPAVIASVDTALLEMISLQPSADNPSKAWDAHSRIEGAKQFIRIWQNLAREPKPLPKMSPDHLPSV